MKRNENNTLESIYISLKKLKKLFILYLSNMENRAKEDIYEALGVGSITEEILGVSQPENTCPFIDSIIKDIDSEIEYYENLKKEVENEEGEDEFYEVECHNSECDEEISSRETKKAMLEDDRSACLAMRELGLAYREAFFNYIIKAFVFDQKGAVYLINIPWDYNIKNSYIGNITTDYSEIHENFELISDWADKWEKALDLLDEYIFNNNINIPYFSNIKSIEELESKLNHLA